MAAYDKTKYYWLKLPTDFFDDYKIRLLLSRENGAEYAIFYIKMLLETINHGGVAKFNEQRCYTVEELGIITHTNPDITKCACAALIELELLEQATDGAFIFHMAKAMASHTTKSAQLKKSQRKRKALPAEMTQGGQMSAKCPPKCPPEYRYKSIENRYNNSCCCEYSEVKEEHNNNKDEIQRKIRKYFEILYPDYKYSHLQANNFIKHNEAKHDDFYSVPMQQIELWADRWKERDANSK